MTTKTATPVAQFTAAETMPTLCNRSGTASFYRITPVKGARIVGTIAVATTSHTVSGYARDDASYPAMWVDFTPNWSSEYARTVDSSRHPISINGREYGTGFGDSVSGYVELYPAAEYRRDWEADAATLVLDGVEYVLRFRLSMFDSVSDAARRVLESLAVAVALDYLDAVKIATQRRDSAKRSAGYAADALNEAQAKYDAAQAKFDAASAQLLDAINAAENAGA